MAYTKIESQQDLDNLIESSGDEPVHCFILLNCNIQTSRDISKDAFGDYINFDVASEEDEVIPKEKFGKSLIGRAIKSETLYLY